MEADPQEAGYLYVDGHVRVYHVTGNLEEIVPELLASVPSHPTQAQLDADAQLPRFVIVFDREGSTHSLLSKL